MNLNLKMKSTSTLGSTMLDGSSMILGAVEWNWPNGHKNP